MADKKISEMTAASAYTGANEFYEIVQGGNTRQGSHDLLKDYLDTLYAPVTSILTSPVAWTPTFTGFGTVTSINARSWRVGAELFFEITGTVGTSTATEARISLGFNGVDGSVTSASTYPTLQACGIMLNSANTNQFSVMVGASKTYIVFGLVLNGAFAGLVKRNGDTISSSGNVISVKGSVRIQGW